MIKTEQETLYDIFINTEEDLSVTTKISYREVDKIVLRNLIEKYKHYLIYFNDNELTSHLRGVIAGWWLSKDELVKLEKAIISKSLPDDPLDLFNDEVDDNNQTYRGK